jgi:hypothetical protein
MNERQWVPPEGEATEGPDIDDAPEDVEEYVAEESGQGLAWVRWLTALAVALVWAWVVVKLNGLNSDVAELSDDFFDSASAPQITQVATQALVQQILYLGIGLAASAVGVVVCLAARRD